MEQTQMMASQGTELSDKYDEDYKVLIKHLQETLLKRLSEGRTSLFRTKTAMKPTVQMVEHGISIDCDLGMVYLGALTEDQRQQYTCSCCFSFLKHYGGTVQITNEGKTKSVLWDAESFPQDNYFFTVVERMQEVVESGRVVGPFKDSGAVWGSFEKGGFEHFAIAAPVAVRHYDRKLTGRQKQAQLREDYRRMALFFSSEKGSVEHLRNLMQILESETLQGDQIIDGAGRWLYETAVERANAKDQRVRENLLWRAVATAPAGFAHPNSTMVGTVLDGLLEGKPMSQIRGEYKAKTRADVYHRPVAAPTLNQLEIAEKLVEQLGVQQSLRRRVGYLSDVPAHGFIWSRSREDETEEAVKPRGVFGHLAPQAKDAAKTEALELPAATMTWNKFVEDVLPKAHDIEIFVPDQNDIFGGLSAAAVGDAPPILMYDSEDARNSVSTYQRSNKDYAGRLVGTPPRDWGLVGWNYYPIKAIITGPHTWGDSKFPQLGELVFFVIEDCYDKMIEDGRAGIALFPQLLKQELREIQRVVEKYSNEAFFEGDVKQQAAGVFIAKGAPAGNPRRLRVKTEFGQRLINIDRWE